MSPFQPTIRQGPVNLESELFLCFNGDLELSDSRLLGRSTFNKGANMKISEIKGYAPALEQRMAKPAAAAQDPVVPVPAGKSAEAGEPERTTHAVTGPTAAPPLMDFQLSGVRNDFSGKYRQAALALEGSIYRLVQSQSALLAASEGSGEVVDLPENITLQQTADSLMARANLESARFRKNT